MTRARTAPAAMAWLALLCACAPAPSPPSPMRSGAPAPSASTSAAASTNRSAEPPPKNAVPSAVAAWVKEHARPLASVEPGTAQGDLEWLGAAIGKARIVGLGEQTHGTREHSRLKHRMFEYLVRKMGFTALTIEAPMPEVFDLDEYVKTGQGDPERAAVALGFWCWKTQEVLDLVKWIRAHNAQTTGRKVSIYGFDMQSTPRAVKILTRHLLKVDPARAKRARDLLAPLANPYEMADYGKRWIASADKIEALASELEAWLASAAPGRPDEPDARALAGRAARIIGQYVKMQRSERGGAVREPAMAEHVRWILDREGAGGRIAVWAHNGHVTTYAVEGFEPLGALLDRALPGDYVSVGFFFDEGSFRAYALPRKVGARTTTFTLERAPTGWIEDLLRSAGHPLAVLPLRDLPADGPVADWFGDRHLARSVGWGFEPTKQENYLEHPVPRDAYDVLVYIRQGSAARPIERLEPDAWPTLDAPLNLDLEDAESARGWSLFGGAYDYQLAAVDDGAQQGKRALELRRAPAPRYGEGFGAARQRIQAAPLRGKRLRLTVQARAATKGDDASAHVSIRAARDAAMRSEEIAYAGSKVSGDAWRRYEITIDVPDKADTIDFGLALVGERSARLDAIQLTEVGAAPRSPGPDRPPAR